MTDTTPRDQLAELVTKSPVNDVGDTLYDSCWDVMPKAEMIADAIIAAGWRPPVRDSEPGEGESAGTPTSAILRYEIRIGDPIPFSVPAGEVVLVHEHRQGLDNRVEVWIRVADGETRTQTVRVFGTGQEIPAGWRSLGSCVAGPFVWHLCGAE